MENQTNENQASPQHKTQTKKELLRIKTGYAQHTNPLQLNTDPDFKTRIFRVLWEMKKEGKAESTIRFKRKALAFLSKHSYLDDPEEVKGFIAKLDRKEGYKRNLCIAYDDYVKRNGLSWTKPQYYAPNKLPKIPQEGKIDLLIASASKKLGLAISISKDSGMRPVEVMSLKSGDIDLQNGIVYPQTAKHGSGRVLKLKSSTLLSDKGPSLC